MHDCYGKKHLGEILNHAALDSGCKNTVRDAEYKAILRFCTRWLSEVNWEKLIKFGDGKIIASEKVLSSQLKLEIIKNHTDWCKNDDLLWIKIIWKEQTVKWTSLQTKLISLGKKWM